MTPDSRIYVAGHRGLAGSALVRGLQARGYRNLVTRTHAELDLIEQRAVREFFQRERPEVVFLAAAKVGGIVANNSYPADFIFQNLAIQTNVLQEAWKAGVRDLLFLGTACIYPRDCPQPIREEYLLTGPLEPTNEPYAIAKIAGIKLCESYKRQYGRQYVSVMPTNLYGPNDNYDLASSHVLPALIRKFHEARLEGRPEGVIWGSGTPRREFLHADDLADACLFLMQTYHEPLHINVGTGEDATIRDLAETIRDVVHPTATLVFDRSKPDGAPRTLLDITRPQQHGWRACTPLRDGIARTYAEIARQLESGAGLRGVRPVTVAG